ncbi:MAG: zf-HC2 domain-containing protein, partial [Nitrospinota bacterium]
ARRSGEREVSVGPEELIAYLEQGLGGAEPGGRPERELRALVRAFIELYRRDPRWDCPPAERLVVLAAGKLPAREAGRIRQHLAGCEHCAHELRWLRECEREGEPAEGGVLPESLSAVLAQRRRRHLADRVASALRELATLRGATFDPERARRAVESLLAPPLAAEFASTDAPSGMEVRGLAQFANLELELGEYKVWLDLGGGELNLRAEHRGEGAGGLPVEVETELGERLYVETDSDGWARIAHLPAGRNVLRVRRPRS